MPCMLFFECPLAVLEERILKRAKYSGRSDDNIESMRKRFNTYKEETMPTVDIFRKEGHCVEVDTSKERQAVYKLVVAALEPFTDGAMTSRPLSEKSEMLLGLRPYPKREKKEDKVEEKKEDKVEEKKEAKIEEKKEIKVEESKEVKVEEKKEIKVEEKKEAKVEEKKEIKVEDKKEVKEEEKKADNKEEA